MRDMISSVATPVRQLKAFEKVPVRAGEKVTVRLEVPFSELMFTNERMERVLEPGEFEAAGGQLVRPHSFPGEDPHRLMPSFCE